MHRNQINIRLSSEILEKIDQKGKRSEVVRKAIERYLSEGDVYQMVDKTIDKKIDDMIEGQKQMILYLEEIKRFQPIINVNYPKDMLPLRVGSEKPIVTVQQTSAAAGRASWFTRIGKRLHRKQIPDE